MPSLYAQYVVEREGKRIIEDENGFATYYFINGYCYVEDVFVISEKRQTGIASSYVNAITEIAKSENHKKLLTSVSPKASGAETSLKSILGYGFKLLSSDKDLIYFEKEI